jgi:transposase-like protein
MMQSSEALHIRAPLTAEEKLEFLARLQQAPSHSKAIAKVAGVSEITLHAWRQAFSRGEALADDVATQEEVKQRVEEALPPEKRPKRRFADELRYAVAKAVIAGEITQAEASKQHDVHPSLISGWVKLVKEKKLKGPPKPRGPATEVVEMQTNLALPPRAPQTTLTRVSSVHEELAKKDAEIARLRRLLQQTQAMLLDNGE